MLSSAAAALQPAGLASAARALAAAAGPTWRAISSSASPSSAAQEPTYTYASPGSSMTEPRYQGGAATGEGHASHHAVGSMAQPAHRVTPSKKARMLKVLSTPQRKLAAQGSGVQMLPPGCSISDPSYSIKDPVYFVDVTESK
ncbi:hypothetical protein Rsub_00010 [Raphidocelis subcapitata]|uniref:Uncharacterized protein n=1 Tax=Raphidocelis subcapitata TaxID=307507 RepID=A0A2V0NK02_9CHLO|nr:hypothetical protein Rsub_00010 [Raphidocelis subcapitata]|eukprot:GBF87299.1 hypothetical protein Rsub_00010 [Raphidocelis subcapitata]